MQCKEVALVIEQEGLVPLPQAARKHMAGCDSCRHLVADLTAIVATAHLIPAEIEPPAHIWVSVRAQLEQEGVIKVPRAAGASWWHGFSGLFTSRALATVGVGLLIAAAIGVQYQFPTEQPVEAHNFYIDTGAALNQDEARLPNMQLASASNVDTTLRHNLDIVDGFIAECEQRVKDQPGDDLARDYLSGAYQQKAELLSVMMERGEGGN
ncbi:MAG TPA: hypothetical protein VGI16_11200 [Candidatus Acidoferrum sp.]